VAEGGAMASPLRTRQQAAVSGEGCSVDVVKLGELAALERPLGGSEGVAHGIPYRGAAHFDGPTHERPRKLGVVRLVACDAGERVTHARVQRRLELRLGLECGERLADAPLAHRSRCDVLETQRASRFTRLEGPRPERFPRVARRELEARARVPDFVADRGLRALQEPRGRAHDHQVEDETRKRRDRRVLEQRIREPFLREHRASALIELALPHARNLRQSAGLTLAGAMA